MISSGGMLWRHLSPAMTALCIMLCACSLGRSATVDAPSTFDGPSQIHIAAPLPGQSFLAGATVIVQARISNAGPDLARVFVLLDGETLGETAQPNPSGAGILPLTLEWLANTAGEYEIAVIAERGDGQSASESVALRVVSDSTPTQAAPEAEAEPVAATPVEPLADPRKGRPEPAEAETVEEPELEPAYATAVEVAPAPAEPGKIRFAEEVLRRIEGLALAEQELARAAINLRLARGRQEVGSGNAIDVQQAEVGVGRAEITLLQSRTGVRNARTHLLQQLGVDLNGEPALTTAFEVTEFDRTAAELYETALGKNPDLQATRARERSAVYGVRMARSSYFPSLSVSTGISGFTRKASSTAGQEAAAIAAGEAAVAQCEFLNNLLRQLPDPPPLEDCARLATPKSALEAIREQNRAFPFDFTRTPPSASLSVSIPVFQGLGRQREVESARAALQDTRFRIREQELALRADIESRLAVVRTAYETALIEERNQTLADEQLRLARERYRLNLLDFIGLVEAETVKAQADRQRLFSIFTYHDAIADLEAVVGTPLRNP